MLRDPWGRELHFAVYKTMAIYNIYIIITPKTVVTLIEQEKKKTAKYKIRWRDN